MIEAGAKDVNNEVVAEAIQYGVKACDEINDFIREIQKKVGKEKVPLIIKVPSSDEKPTREELKKMTEDIVNKEAPKYYFPNY